MLNAKKHLKDIYRSEMKKDRAGMLRLDMNEGIPGLPQRFVNGLLKRITADDISAYPEHADLEKKIGRDNGLKADNVFLSNGSDAVIKYIFEVFVSPGERVVYTDPTFAMYPIYCSLSKAKGQAVPYGPDFVFPAESFIDAVKKGCRMAVIVNPNNPTGSVIGKAELKKIADICSKKGTLLIIDEAYFYYYPETAVKMIKKYKNICVLRTFSKICGMAGLRFGFCLADKKIIDGLKKVRPTFDVNRIAIMFAEAILDSPKIIPILINQAREGKEYLVSELDKYDIEYRSCRTNFILIKCPGKATEISGKLEERGILVGSGFRQDFLKDYIRVTAGAVPEMKRFMSAFVGIAGKK